MDPRFVAEGAMRNNGLALGFLALAGAVPAVAQETGRAPAVPSTSLDAYRHHQPRAGDVEQRELDRGKNFDERQRREQADLDRLYDDIMRDSAPKPETTAPPRR
jgi:hypothetical protein